MVSPDGTATPPFSTWETAAQTIQDAITLADQPGDRVLVEAGEYTLGSYVGEGAQPNRIAITRPIIVQSVRGPAATHIVGQGPRGDEAVRCAYVCDGAQLIGFTLRNGATITNGDVRVDQSGGGVWAASNGVIERCVIANNAAQAGGGAAGGILRNCILMHNNAFGGGGAMNARLEHCVVANNAAANGGGTIFCDVINSIVYFNRADKQGGNFYKGYFVHSCTTPRPPGESNLVEKPRFIDEVLTNFALRAESPCIDAVDVTEVREDFLGVPRPLKGSAGATARSDIGAFEFQSEEADSDDDGLSDRREIDELKTLPTQADTDRDGLSDGEEVLTHGTSPLRVDSDDDGLSDRDELVTHKTDPTKADTDQDGLSDGEEVLAHETNPLLGDTDGDELPDGWEVRHGLNPKQPDSEDDTDGDGLSNAREFAAQTNPTEKDTDQDGLTDGTEVDLYNTQPTLADTDEDGLTDGDEINRFQSHPLEGDSDRDGLSDREEVLVHRTSPVKADTDNDGQSDALEILVGTDPRDIDSLVTTLSGVIGRPEAMDGDIWVVARGTDAEAAPRSRVLADASGAYTLTNLASKTSYRIEAFVDRNDNGAHEPGEAGGACEQPVTIRLRHPPVSFSVAYLDWDGDGIRDDEEIARGFDPNSNLDPLWVDDHAPGDPKGGDPALSDPLEDGTRAHPFDTIQEAVDTVKEGGTVLVQEGVYAGDGNRLIDFKGKKLRLASVAGPEKTIIDTTGLGSGFLLVQREGRETVIEGFTVRTWKTFGGGEGFFCENASPQIKNCAVIDSRIGVTCVNGAEPLLLNLRLEDNDGGILCAKSSPVIDGCIIRSNRAERGAGIRLEAGASPRIVNTLFVGNVAETTGGGLYVDIGCSPTIVNCTFVGNAAELGAALASVGHPTMRNTIVWGNYPRKYRSVLYRDAGHLDIQFSNLEVFYPGMGNISMDPAFEPDGSFRLSAGSPAIDQGTDHGAPERDLGGRLRPMDGNGDGVVRADMGVHEHPGALDAAKPHARFAQEAPEPGSSSAKPARDAAPHTLLTGRIWVDDDGPYDPAPGTPAQSDPNENGSSEHPFDSIQEAIDAAAEGAVVSVQAGAYQGPGNRSIDLKGKAITVLGLGGPDATSIDASGAGAGFVLTSRESDQTRVEGFAVRTWKDFGGGPGVLCSGSRAVLRNLRLSDCAVGVMCQNDAEPRLERLVLAENTHGLVCSKSAPIVEGCLFVNNRGPRGAGASIDQRAAPRFVNCVFEGNQAEDEGGGLDIGAACRVSLINCTLINNTAREGAALASRGQTRIRNGILWNNESRKPRSSIYRASGSIDIQYSNLDVFYPGVGNISSDPMFNGAGDWGLRPRSPCIDRGLAPEAPDQDKDGRLRPMDGDGDGVARADMGAYELGGPVGSP